jgi:hypothetical protein
LICTNVSTKNRFSMDKLIPKIKGGKTPVNKKIPSISVKKIY